jgi:transposase
VPIADIPGTALDWRIALPAHRISSGASVKRGGVTKAGNGAARRLLIEAAWTYRFPARLSRELLLRQESQPRAIREIAWKAQPRLCALSQARPGR